jgi:hypothetical protein
MPRPSTRRESGNQVVCGGVSGLIQGAIVLLAMNNPFRLAACGTRRRAQTSLPATSQMIIADAGAGAEETVSAAALKAARGQPASGARLTFVSRFMQQVRERGCPARNSSHSGA